MRSETRQQIKEITKSFIVLFVFGFILYNFYQFINNNYGESGYIEIDIPKIKRNINILSDKYLYID